MEIYKVTYNNFKDEISNKALKIYHSDDNGDYIVYGLSQNYLIKSYISEPSEKIDFENNLSGSSIFSETENEIIALSRQPNINVNVDFPEVVNRPTFFEKWNDNIIIGTDWTDGYSYTNGIFVFLGCAFRLSNASNVSFRLVIDEQVIFEESIDDIDALGLFDLEAPMWFRQPKNKRFQFLPPEKGLVVLNSIKIQFKKSSGTRKIQLGRTWRRTK